MALSSRKQKRIEAARQHLRNQLDLGRTNFGAVLREMQLDGIAPSRSTFYEWVRAERAVSAADKSGAWSLADDKTGRPDIVLEVLSGIYYDSNTRVRSISHDEAQLIVRIATAVPEVLDKPEGAWLIHSYAHDYMRAKAANDQAELALLDVKLGSNYIERARQRVEAWRANMREREVRELLKKERE